MRQIIHKTAQNLPDVTGFIELIKDPPPKLRGFFDSHTEIYVARAPGRLDVMGGIADYSGSLVLEMPIREATLAALQTNTNQKIKIISLSDADEDADLTFEMPLDDFLDNGKPIEYEQARLYFEHHIENHWAAYIAGVFLVLMRERSIEFKSGSQILFSSQVPKGKGVSSSAALEVATMQAVSAAFHIPLEPKATALLCQKVENLIVGAPCGVMDQMTSVCGEENRLLSLVCQPAEIQETIEIPEEISFWGIDSGVRHSVVGADYASVRVGAFMGYRIIAEIAGLKTQKIQEGLVKIEDARWNGYLSNLTPSEFEQFYTAQIPEQIRGEKFLNHYGGTTDSVTKIIPEKLYDVRVPTAHAVYEHHRVRAFAELLKGRMNDRRLEILGELMFQSHASYAACDLCETGTNRLVELVRKNESQNLYGAKITGGGSGGVVAILGRRESDAAVLQIAAQYERETGLKSFVFQGSSPGAAMFGFLKFQNG